MECCFWSTEWKELSPKNSVSWENILSEGWNNILRLRKTKRNYCCKTEWGVGKRLYTLINGDKESRDRSIQIWAGNNIWQRYIGNSVEKVWCWKSQISVCKKKKKILYFSLTLIWKLIQIHKFKFKLYTVQILEGSWTQRLSVSFPALETTGLVGVQWVLVNVWISAPGGDGMKLPSMSSYTK